MTIGVAKTRSMWFLSYKEFEQIDKRIQKSEIAIN